MAKSASMTEDKSTTYFRGRVQELFGQRLPEDPQRALFITFDKGWRPSLVRPEGASEGAHIPKSAV